MNTDLINTQAVHGRDRPQVPPEKQALPRSGDMPQTLKQQPCHSGAAQLLFRLDAQGMQPLVHGHTSGKQP